MIERDLKRLAISELPKLVVGDYDSLSPPLYVLIKDVLGIPPDHLKLVELLISLGVPEEKAVAVLNWREFEDLCSEILEGRGYYCLRRVRKSVSGRRMELDVVALSEGRLILVECKMWSKSILRFLVSRSRREVNRKLELLIDLLSEHKAGPGAFQVIPVIVSWLSMSKGMKRGEVPVVPLYKFPYFVDSLDELLDDIKHVNLDFKPNLKELFNLR